MTTQGLRRRSAYFICGPNLSGAEIKLGANAGRSQRRGHALIVGDAVLVEYGDDHRPGLRLGLDLAEMGEGGLEPRYADGEAGRGHRLSAEAGDEAVVAPATRDRAEADRLAIIAADGEGKFDLVDGAGVVFEAADD